MFKLFRKKTIGDPHNPYLHRWFIIPRNKWFNIYLHKFMRSDDDRAHHDHPWVSLSLCLKGTMFEHHSCRFDREGGSMNYVRDIKPGSLRYRSAEFAHRLEIEHGPVWTLFITGPRTREWGFSCRKGWRHWKEFEHKNGCEGLE